MDLALLERASEFKWVVPPTGSMRVPGVIYASEPLVRDMDHKVYQQVVNVATLPGIEGASYAMPDAHWGYGFPIGGVAAFRPDGVVSGGGVGFDISCGVRTLLTGLAVEQVTRVPDELATELARRVPAGVGSRGGIHLSAKQMNAMLKGGAQWAVEQGYGVAEDLARTEEQGCIPAAAPDEVSALAKRRQEDEMGTLGSGNHYLEVQRVETVYDEPAAAAFGLRLGDVVVSIHCGSRGLGHQIGTEFLKHMAVTAARHGIELPDRELACAPIQSELGQRYLGAMRAGVNCALANRQIITHLVRQSFDQVLPAAQLSLFYDVSHNTCKVEDHVVDGERRTLYVHRKGATRAFGPGHPDLPPELRAVGQPVLVGGTMGTASYVLAGTAAGESQSLSSSCHGAGRAMSRHAALRRWDGRRIREELSRGGVRVRARSLRGLAEEAPGAYKDVGAVVDAADGAGLSRKVARLIPMICVKG